MHLPRSARTPSSLPTRFYPSANLLTMPTDRRATRDDTNYSTECCAADRAQPLTHCGFSRICNANTNAPTLPPELSRTKMCAPTTPYMAIITRLCNRNVRQYKNVRGFFPVATYASEARLQKVPPLLTTAGNPIRNIRRVILVWVHVYYQRLQTRG